MSEPAMRVAIIGAGNVGTTLGRGWLRAGHHLEPLGMLWINLALAQGLGRGIAFTLQRRDT
jgi:predicted dinucleotide-binding enzyme